MSAAGPRVRVLLVDDHALLRAGVRAEIAGAVDVVGEAGTVADAVSLIAAERPDVVLLDVHMPDGGGLAVLRGVASQEPPTRFLALSVSDAAEDVIALIRAGARGYVTKAISGPDLVAAIERVADGDAVFSPRLAGFVLDAFKDGDAEDEGTAVMPPEAGSGAAAGDVEEDAGEQDLDRLTPREREVLRFIARGYMYKEVALRLGISAKTVESHVSAVLRKLQLSSRHELTRWANERQLLDE
jgi:DNA-binding NarL/FixJ family response regulator